MGFRLFRHTLSQVSVPGGSDQVLGGVALPSESTLNNIWGECHVIGTNVTFTNAFMYGVKGVTVFIDDIDTSVNFDSLWDTQVPKDQELANAGFDLSGVADATPEFEPGEPDVTAILDYKLFDDDAEWFKRRKLLTFAVSKGGYLDGTPDTYSPTDFFKIRSKRNQNVEVASVAMLGFSAPALDDTTTAVFDTPASEAELIQAKYIEIILEQAWMALVGLTETGAETPYDEAMAFLADYLLPDVFEESAGAFGAMTWQVFTAMTFDFTVPGRREIKQLSLA